MRVTKNYTIVVTDDSGNPIEVGDTLMFLYDGKTRLAVFNGFDKRSRVILSDFMTNEEYTCMLSSIMKSRKIESAIA
jgi:hypothetical protein